MLQCHCCIMPLCMKFWKGLVSQVVCISIWVRGIKLICEELFIFLLFLGLQVKPSIAQTFLVEAQHGPLQKVIAIQNNHLEHILIREGKGLKNTVFVSPMVG